MPSLLPPSRWLARFNYIVNFSLVGCSTPQFLVIDLARPADNQLIALLFLPEVEDVLQSLFDNNPKRNSGPERRGRKRPRPGAALRRRTALPKKLPVFENPGSMIGGRGPRIVLPILNIYEGINFSVALIDAAVDERFNTIVGFMQVDQNACQEFVRMVRESPGEDIASGSPGIIDSVSCENLIDQSGMFSSPLTTTCPVDCTVFFGGTAFNQDNTEKGGRFALGTANDDIKHESGMWTLSPGQSVEAGVTGNFKAGDAIVWGWSGRGDGPVTIQNAYCYVVGVS